MTRKTLIYCLTFIFNTDLFGQCENAIFGIMPSIKLIIDSNNLQVIKYRGQDVFVFENIILNDDSSIVVPPQLPDGNYCAFFAKDTSLIACSVTYKDTKLNGEAKYYYKNGTLRALRSYKNGELNGQSIFYYSNGQIDNYIGHLKGRLHGQHVTYYPDGIKQSECSYKKGKQHGRCFQWDCKGNITYEY